MSLELITIVTLPKERRVTCQHDGCGRHVYAKVHVIRHSDTLSFVGHVCFRKLFGHHELQPSIGGKDGTRLNDEEREQIVSNTEAFLTELKARYETLVAESLPAPSANVLTPLRPSNSGLALGASPSPPRRVQPTHIHLFRCLACSTRLLNYEFEGTERLCPRCNNPDEVFTIEKFLL